MNRIIPELTQFIQAIPLQKYDYFVPIERKGMALMRFLLRDENKIGLDVNKLVSSEATEYLDRSWFEKKKVCVFDDTLFTGRKMTRQIADFRKRGADADSSAFAVCEFAEFKPTYGYFNGLTFPDYAVLRSQILDLISESQILLLDTEHIGLRLHCSLSPKEIIERLRELGGPLIVARVGKENRQFISIHKPSYFDETLAQLKPENDLGVFSKLRFLIQDDSTVWVVPIVYPPTLIPTSFQDCPAHAAANEHGICLCADFPDSSIRPLYCRSMYWSSILLAQTLRRLKGLMEFKYDLSDPEDFPVENLKALFPMMNISGWKSWLTEVFTSAINSPDVAKHETKYPLISFDDKTDAVTRQLANMLLEKYENVEVQRIAAEDDKWFGKEQFTLSYDEIFSRFADVPAYYVSQALDILIDQSVIIPTELKVIRDGKTYWVRGARLDGEYTYHQARRLRRSLQVPLGREKD